MEEHDEALALFISITTAPSKIAEEYLEVGGWNVQRAMELYWQNDGRPLETQLPRPPISRDPIHQDPVLREKTEKEEEVPPIDDVREPIPQSRGILVEENILAIHHRPPASPFQLLNGCIPLGMIPPELKGIEHAGPLGHVEEDVKALPLQHTLLADIFRPPLDLIRAGTLDFARHMAKREDLWLVVIMADSSFESQQMNKLVWSNMIVRDVLRRWYSVWYRNRLTTEGAEYVQLYPTTAFPSFAILDPRTGRRLKEFSGYMKAEEVSELLIGFHEEHSLAIPTETETQPPLKPKEETTDALLEEQEVEEEPEEKAENKPIEALSEAEAMERALALSRQETEEEEDAVVVFKEPDSEPESDDPLCTRIRFRMPDGSMFVRRFLRMDTVEQLYVFAHWHLKSDRDLVLVMIPQTVLDDRNAVLESVGVLQASVAVRWK